MYSTLRPADEFVVHHRHVRDVLQHAAEVPPDVANAKRRVRQDLPVNAEHDLVLVRELGFRIDDVGAHARQNEVIRHIGGEGPLRHQPRQPCVEVVAAREPVVGREGAGRQVVRDAGIVLAVVAVDLRPAIARRIECGADARRPVVLQRVVRDDGADELLLLVSQTRIDRQPIADRPRVLDEEVVVVLERRPLAVVVRPRHPENLPEYGIRQHGDRRAGRRLTPVGSEERRARALIDLRIYDVIVPEPVLQLVTAENMCRLGRVLPAQAAVARFVAADTAGDPGGGNALVGDAPVVDCWQLADLVERSRPCGLEEPSTVDHAVVAHRLLVAAVVEGAERGSVGDEQRRSPLRP